MQFSVLLVEPESAGNIGFIARAMANFGLSDLILVKPKCEVGLEARTRAMHAWPVIEKARRADSFEEAVEGFDFVIGTTGKVFSDYNLVRTFVTPRELAERSATVKGKAVLVLGRESVGLRTAELAECDVVVHILAHKRYPVMNISHAAAIIFYELFAEKRTPFRTADAREKDVLMSMFSSVARSKKVGLRGPEHMIKMFNTLINRGFISGREAHGLAGLLNRLEKLTR